MSVEPERRETSEPTPSAPLGDKLTDEAVRLIAARGIKALSIRSLAAAAGVSVGAVTYRLGDKDRLTIAAFEAARQADQETMRAFLGSLGDRPLGVADVLDAAAVHCLDRSPERARIEQVWLELVQQARFHPELRPTLAAWLGERGDCWRALFGRAGLPGQAADALLHYLVADYPTLLAAPGDGVTALSLMENIRRLCAPDLAARRPPVWYDALSERHGHPLRAEAEARRLMTDTERQVVRAAIAAIVSHGVAGVTHRLVAQIGAVSLSATTYYFASREDIVRQAFQELYFQLLDTMPSNGITGAMPLPAFLRSLADAMLPAEGDVSAASAVTVALNDFALEATRDPSLAPLFLRLRQFRGARVVRAFNWALKDIQPVSNFEAHVLSSWLHGRVQMLGALAPAGAADLLVGELEEILPRLFPDNRALVEALS